MVRGDDILGARLTCDGGLEPTKVDAKSRAQAREAAVVNHWWAIKLRSHRTPVKGSDHLACGFPVSRVVLPWRGRVEKGVARGGRCSRADQCPEVGGRLVN